MAIGLSRPVPNRSGFIFKRLTLSATASFKNKLHTNTISAEFQENEVYAIDIVAISGDGKVSTQMFDLNSKDHLFMNRNSKDEKEDEGEKKTIP
ncbi:hypothetical protein F2Q68_00011157 [Brassica cretica]|uniref:Uncharacterized protein n=1 Tax=Brassica cretica TaxID=69181 RepID=A0A8S9KTZ7_BRACR|nr:hypothetical protein F2Q68_00011157 [Brassica cretica]